MNPKQIAMAIAWLAILGLVVIIAARGVSAAGRKASAAL